MEREVFVSVDLHGAPVFVGRLWCRNRGGRQSATFEYDPSWLEHQECFAIDPALTLTTGPFHTAGSVPLFGAMSDAAPDRWGRMLLRRAESRRAVSGFAPTFPHSTARRVAAVARERRAGDRRPRGRR